MKRVCRHTVRNDHVVAAGIPRLAGVRWNRLSSGNVVGAESGGDPRAGRLARTQDGRIGGKSIPSARVASFLATSELVGGPIRAVIIRFDDGSWAPYFCTDTSAEVRDILQAVAARWAIEEHFCAVKEIWGAGQQQVRKRVVQYWLLELERLGLHAGQTVLLEPSQGRADRP